MAEKLEKSIWRPYFDAMSRVLSGKRAEIEVAALDLGDAISGVSEFEKLNRTVEAARLKVPIAEAFPLERAAKAHERFAEGHVLGKIVLRVHHP